MFSRLDNIFKIQDRHAEKLDTRQAIRRQEPDSQKSGEDEDNRASDDSLWEDSTAISINGLQSFLEGLVAEKSSKENQAMTRNGIEPENEADNEAGNEHIADSDNESGAPVLNRPPPERNIRAAMAYQRTKDTSYPEQAIHNPNVQKNSAADPAGSSGDSDIHGEGNGGESTMGGGAETAQDVELTSVEKRAIFKIIDDLKQLSAQGHTELVIQKAESFLQGIINAIDDIKPASA